MPHMKRTVKDSVFTYLFQDPQYTLHPLEHRTSLNGPAEGTRQLYRSLHGDDDGVEEKDIEVITLTNVLVDDIYNDLGFLVKGRLIVLVEAQSTFSRNIAYRMLLYMAATFKAYADREKMDGHSRKDLHFPHAEVYVIYTGEGEVPDVCRFSDLCEKGKDEEDVDVETRVHVLRGDAADKNDIVRQYVRFCKIADEERRKGGPTAETVERIIDRCIKENVLAAFLASRRREVEDMMVVLFDEKKVREIHEYNVRKDALEEGRAEGIVLGVKKGRAEGMKKGRAEGMKKGRAEGREKGIAAMVATLKRLALAKNTVVQELIRNFQLSPQAAAAKVEQYWD